MDKHDLAICGEGIEYIVRQVEDKELLGTFLAQVSIYAQGLRFVNLSKIVGQIQWPKGKASAVKYLYPKLVEMPTHTEDLSLYSNIHFEQYQDQIKKTIAKVKGY